MAGTDLIVGFFVGFIVGLFMRCCGLCGGDCMLNAFNTGTIHMSSTQLVSRGRSRSVVSVGGTRYEGSSVEIRNGVVYVDGQRRSPDGAALQVSISADAVEGGIHLDVGDVTVAGDVAGNVSTTSGKIDIKGAVTGGASTVSGRIDIGGSVGGSVRTVSGRITHH